MTTFLRINAAQAEALRGKYGEYHELNPVPLLGTSDFILTDAVLTEPAYATALATLQALPTYPAWSGAGVAYKIGDICEYNGLLRRCLQNHNSQPDWTPTAAVSLWVLAHRDDEVVPWVQPAGSHDTWPINALTIHNGRVWKSLTANNTYEPGVIGTWRDQSVPPMWVASAGAIGTWQVNEIAEHNGQVWRNTAANNSFAPGVWGWVLA